MGQEQDQLMNDGTKTQRQSAREKIARQRAAQQQRRRRLLLAGGSALVVLAIVATFIGIKLAGGNSAAGGAAGRGTSSASVTRAITTVPASTLNAVGAGTASRFTLTKGQPVLMSGGKPEVLYIGGEFCPYCAAQRWAMVVALSRFGTFSGLHYIHSSSTDVYPNTPTLSFYKSGYTSKYLTFTPVEWYSVTHTVLQPPTSAQLALFKKYDGPPYVPAADAGSFPFVNIGNQALILGSQYQPSAFSGLTWSQVAAAIRDPSSAIAKDVNGAANQMTAELCKLTHGQPGGVCTAPGVKAAAG
jgi:hypothetical protein